MRFLNRLPEYVLAIQQCAEPRISIAFLVASCLDTCALQQLRVGFLQHTEFVCIAFQDDCIVSRMKNSAKMCRSRRKLSNEYLLAKIGVDTAENEPLEVWGKIQFTIHFTP